MCTNKLTYPQLACQRSWIKALHWNHRGHEFRFRTGLNFFQTLFSLLLIIRCVHYYVELYALIRELYGRYVVWK